MKHLITSVGRTVFKNRSILAFRAPGLDPQQPRNMGVERQHPNNTGLDTGAFGGKTAQGTRAAPQQGNETQRSWEDEKSRIGFNTDKHEMPWVAQAKRKTNTMDDNITGAKKFHQNDQNFGASSKTSQATDFVKRKPISQEKQYAGMASQNTNEMKDRESFADKAKDTLNQAAEFVKKEASVNPADFQSNKADESHGLFGTIKESASHAVDWVKEKISGEHHQNQETNQSFKAGEETKQTISEKNVREQAQPKVDKGVKSDIGKIIDKGIPDQNK